MHAERPLRRPRRAAPRQPHGRRPREAALRQPRALQGRPRRRGARRLPRQGHRAARTRRRPTPSRPTRTCCSRARRSSTPRPRSRSSPTTSSASTARRPASSTPRPLFYLRSRGIGEAAARALLTQAFAARRRRADQDPGAARGRRAGARRAALRRRRGGRAMSTAVREARSAYDVAAIRQDFPILATKVYGKPLVYLDNAASAQKPRAVIDAERDVYEKCNANIHRGVHWLSVHATDAYDAAREKARAFLNAREAHEIIFVRGTTEAINLVAQTYGRAQRRRGRRDPHHRPRAPLEHRALADALRGEGRAARGRADRRHGRRRPRRARAAAHAAHEARLGGPPLERPRHDPPGPAHRRARARPRHPGLRRRRPGGRRTCRSTCRTLDCDFYAFSGHKIYGPTGVGVLYGKTALLEAMPPGRAAAT